VSKAIVIGAGVIGCSIALELARQGYEVIALDKAQSPGQGSSNASSAVVRFNYSTFDSVALAWESFHCWKNWPEHLGNKQERYSEMIDVGVVMLDAPVISGEKTSQLFEAVGVPYEVWSSDELAHNVNGIDVGKYWPPKRLADEAFWEDPKDSLGAIFTPNGGYIDDPLLATQNLAQAALNTGVTFRFKTTVTAILREGDKTLGVEINNSEKIFADIVINVGGPWSNQINALAGVGQDFTISVRAMRQEVHQINTPMNLLPGPIIGDLDLGTYMRSTPTGSTLIGGTEPECDGLVIPFSLQSRTEDGMGTNPEELIGAAHAGCFSMALTSLIEDAGKPVGDIETSARVTLEQREDGFWISEIHLITRGRNQSLTEAEFKDFAAKAKLTCPVSKLYSSAVITLDAALA